MEIYPGITYKLRLAEGTLQDIYDLSSSSLHDGDNSTLGELLPSNVDEVSIKYLVSVLKGLHSVPSDRTVVKLAERKRVGDPNYFHNSLTVDYSPINRLVKVILSEPKLTTFLDIDIADKESAYASIVNLLNPLIEIPQRTTSQMSFPLPDKYDEKSFDKVWASFYVRRSMKPRKKHFLNREYKALAGDVKLVPVQQTKSKMSGPLPKYKVVVKLYATRNTHAICKDVFYEYYYAISVIDTRTDKVLEKKKISADITMYRVFGKGKTYSVCVSWSSNDHYIGSNIPNEVSSTPGFEGSVENYIRTGGFYHDATLLVLLGDVGDITVLSKHLRKFKIKIIPQFFLSSNCRDKFQAPTFPYFYDGIENKGKVVHIHDTRFTKKLTPLKQIDTALCS